MDFCARCGCEGVIDVDGRVMCASHYVELDSGVDPLESYLNEYLRLLSNRDLQFLGSSRESTVDILWSIREEYPVLEDRWIDVFNRFLD